MNSKRVLAFGFPPTDEGTFNYNVETGSALSGGVAKSQGLVFTGPGRNTTGAFLICGRMLSQSIP